MKPVVDRLQARYSGKVDLYLYAEADKNQEAQGFAMEHGITSVPTLVVVDAAGTEIERFSGTTPERTVANALEKARSTAAAVDAAENP